MQRLKDAIQGKERWSGLESYILLVNENREINPNAALDGAKSILESISKTILEDKSINYNADSNLEFLVKKAFESLPVFTKLATKDLGSAKSIVGSFENISRVIGEFRNGYGFFSHGHDLQAEKFDRYLVELAISSSDLISSFLVISHAEDLRDRNRVYYEENDEFNRYIDETSEEYPVVRGIELSPSRALYSDIEAYKEELLSFVNEKTGLLERLELSDRYVTTRSICSDLIPLQNFLTVDELKRAVRACINNSQIFEILGHGYTRNLFSWIRKEKFQVLSEEEQLELGIAFTKKLY